MISELAVVLFLLLGVNIELRKYAVTDSAVIHQEPTVD